MMEEKEGADRVSVDQPETMNILGLLMKGLLALNMEDEAKYARACKLKGDILVTAGAMSVTLRFADNKLTIIRGATEKPKAKVAGTMGALLGVVTGEGMVLPFLAGKLKIGGNPFTLLKMLPLIQSPK